MKVLIHKTVLSIESSDSSPRALYIAGTPEPLSDGNGSRPTNWFN